jgi:hypothetical protein
LFFYLIVELFRQCSIYCFSIWLWNCSDSVVFIVFLFDCGTVQTVWYLCYHTVWTVPQSNRKIIDTTLSEQFHNQIEKHRYHTVWTVPQSKLFRQCGIYCFSIWLWNCSDKCDIYCFSIWLWNCSDSVVFIVTVP